MKLVTGVLFLCYAAVVTADGEESNTRIANFGETASENEFPFLVSIQMGHQHFCGGSLISKTHVLTAAHCVQPGVDMGYFPEPLAIEVGMNQLGLGTRYKVKRVSYLRGFHMQDPNMLFLPKDIAVIHLTESVETSEKVATINLPSADSSLPIGTKVVTAGFGVDNILSTQISRVLKKMDAKVVNNEDCQKYLIPRLHVGKMCAGKGAGYGTCKGDSGGPLVDEAKTTLIGIVSGGDGECKKGTPDVYTEVSRFLTYINEELNWKPGTTTQNPSLDFEKKSSNTYPTPPPRPPTQFPGGWPWPPQVPQHPQHPQYPQHPLNPLIPQPPQPVPYVPMNSQQNHLSHLNHWAARPQQFQNPLNLWGSNNPWQSQQLLMPCPPGWQPLNPLNLPKPSPQQPLDPQKPHPQLPWEPQQPWKPQNPFPQQPQMPSTQNPQYPWFPQRPHNPFQPQDPLDPSNPDLEESISA